MDCLLIYLKLKDATLGAVSVLTQELPQHVANSQLTFRTRNDQELEDAEFELMPPKQTYEMEK